MGASRDAQEERYARLALLWQEYKAQLASWLFHGL